MKILDRYISSSVAAAFVSGVTIFMVLLCAMSLFKGFIALINEHGLSPATALVIFAYKIPGMLVYAFPMAVLLGILLVFSRMSSESEMVAMRAGGVSFVRIAVPAIIISLLVTGITFVISNYYAPYASKRSTELEHQAFREAKADTVAFSQKDEHDALLYSIQAGRLEIENEKGVMTNVSVTYFRQGAPFAFVYAPRAEYDYTKGYWLFTGEGAFITPLDRSAREMSLKLSANGTLDFTAEVFRLKVSPFRLSNEKKDPAELTSDDIRQQVAEMRKEGASPRDLGKWLTRLAQRYSTPFSCIVFALIGAPLGLRHHRTSSAVGFGISLLVIFAFYFANVYVTSFGDSGAISPHVAAWAPNVLGGILGIILLIRANR